MRELIQHLMDRRDRSQRTAPLARLCGDALHHGVHRLRVSPELDLAGPLAVGLQHLPQELGKPRAGLRRDVLPEPLPDHRAPVHVAGHRIDDPRRLGSEPLDAEVAVQEALLLLCRRTEDT